MLTFPVVDGILSFLHLEIIKSFPFTPDRWNVSQCKQWILADVPYTKKVKSDSPNITVVSPWS